MDNMATDTPSRPEMAVVFGACAFSGFLMGLLVGWVVWS